MKFRPALLLLLLSFAVSLAFAQETAQPAPDQGARQGRRSGRGAWGGGMGLGRGLLGTVTEVANDHYTVRTDSGETYVVHFSVNTRMMKQAERRRRPGDASDRNDAPPAAPQALKPAEIKVGDLIAANGEIDAAQKSIGAVVIVQLDPERARQMRAMEQNFGKTWLMGRVMAIHEVSVTVQGGPGNSTHTFSADENTTFRKRRDPITLADIQVGDMVRAEGALKDGNFVAASVIVMGRPSEGDGAQKQDSSPDNGIELTPQ